MSFEKSMFRVRCDSLKKVWRWVRFSSWFKVRSMLFGATAQFFELTNANGYNSLENDQGQSVVAGRRHIQTMDTIIS